MDRLGHALQNALREQSSVTILFIDLDRFKLVNDGFGHGVGDQLLVAVSQRLTTCLRPGDTLARLGGDEFTVLLAGAPTMAETNAISDRILLALQPPVHLSGQEVYAMASIGIAASFDTTSPDALLREADIALYHAKTAGKGRWSVFDATMGASPVFRVHLESELHRALERGGLRVHYQPIVNLADGRIEEVEALVRWYHPERGMVGPDDFIPVAEETGLIVPLGQFVLDEACRQLRTWQHDYPRATPLVMSVNLSARQFQHPELVGDIHRAVQTTGLDPSTLKLEITESVVMHDRAERDRAGSRAGIERHQRRG